MNYIPNIAQALRLLPAALVFLACDCARADTFYMKSGNEIEGVMVSEDAAAMLVDIGYGTVNLEKADILKIRRATKAQREAAGKQRRRGKFKSGGLVPKGAEKLAGLWRAADAAREKAFEARELRAEGEKGTKTELSALKKEYRELAEELEEIDVKAEPEEYNSVVEELNKTSARIQVKELAAGETVPREESPDFSFQAYLDAYGRLESYLLGEGKPLMEAPRKGQDAEYFSWLAGDAAEMKRDFNRDAVESESRNGHLIVKALLNGRVSARLMVDTGATTTVLYRDVSDALKLGPRDMLRTVTITLGDGSRVQAQEVRLRSVTVGKSAAKDTTAVILPSDSAGMDGLLGMSFLSHFLVRVDSGNGKLILESLK